ncbi:FAD-binding and (Fe-S)-binding domain-containing protein [Dactylosporangium sp. NPDC050588]|uniref:FAD-binding and (Fe-S)-binding domain-containing protein n=1 Tax=Dactylosporangium sp. NPDC050588 TaxID=3157211 RepID=UPI0033EA49CE
MTTLLPAPRVRTARPAGVDVDAQGLAAALRQRIHGGVRFDDGTRALYATDASNYRQVPIGVVVPRTLDDVVATVATCREFGAPLLSRGGGTSLAGECCNVAVVMDFSKHLNAIESIDGPHRRAVVQPGLVLDQLNAATRRHGGLVFGPKPATHSHCTIGGMVGNNSCGSTAQWSGTTAANVERLEILTYDGERMWVGETSDEEYRRILAAGGRRAEIYRAVRDLRDRYAGQIRAFPKLPRRISGYNLPALLPEHSMNLAQALVGTESTCVTVLRAQLRLLPEPPKHVLVLMAFPDIAAAADAVPTINRYAPTALEGLDDKLIRYEGEEHMRPEALKLLPEPTNHTGRGAAWLMVDVGADTVEEAKDRVHRMLDELGHDEGKVFDDPEHQAQLWAVREGGLGATARTPGGPDTWPGWEDSAVPPERLGDYLRDFQRLLHRHGYDAASLYGHFGDGCLHTSIPFDLVTAGGVADFRTFVEQAADLVSHHGGSYSGEHGDGQARGELLTKMYGPDVVQAFEEFKAIFDPDNRMNPGKVVHANPLDGQLRLGAGYAPAEPATYFRYTEDSGSFARAALRCAGVGACRRPEPDQGVMCPSYQVTGDEEHSTRGRARLLFEMVRGETITGGWREQSVADALDLCLACKGCKRDCPMHVDMATYKAEFLAHHHAGRIRPRSHYSLGWLPAAARLAALAPDLVNAVTHAPGLGAAVKRLGGIDPRRDLPRFAGASFQRWMRNRTPGGTGERGTVLLWPDTFTTYLSPGIAASAVGALEAVGFRVELPRGPVCCGLTWISTGQLGVARRVLRRTVDTLAPWLRAGVPVVGLEPSCTAVFRGDTLELLGHDQDALRLRKQTRTLAELLVADHDLKLPELRGEHGERPHAISQTHCHHHAVLGHDADVELQRRVGLEVDQLASGCCGLAGDFGMTPDHRDVSLAVGEQVLLPAVREAAACTLILADGFSCRTQIEEAGTDRHALHLAEVVNAALRGVPAGERPERALSVRPEARAGRS